MDCKHENAVINDFCGLSICEKCGVPTDLIALRAEYAESMKHAVHMYETAARERDDALRRVGELETELRHVNGGYMCAMCKAEKKGKGKNV